MNSCFIHAPFFPLPVTSGRICISLPILQLPFLIIFYTKEENKVERKKINYSLLLVNVYEIKYI